MTTIDDSVVLRRGRSFLGAIVLALMCSGAAYGHALAPSLLQIEQGESGRAEVLWKTPLLRVPGSELTPILPAYCKPVGRAEARQEDTAAILRQTVDCGDKDLVGGRIEVTGIAGSKTDVLLRVALADGRTFRQVLTADEPFFLVPEREKTIDVLRGYLTLGFEHIIGGFDHLLFILGLVLLVGGGRRLLWTVTAFTVGHSVTLSLAVLGFVHIPQQPIEALIAFSIFVLAVELARGEEAEQSLVQRQPWAVAFTFGLLHGLGFAGALSAVGLPADDIPLALFSFNIGIELGQIAFVFAVLAVREVVRPLTNRLPVPTAWIPPYVIGTLAAFWMFQRISLSL